MRGQIVSIPGTELKIKAGEAPDLRILLPNRAENVTLVRHLLTGIGAVLELEEDLMIDINASVSEACNNVVLHAYGGGEGMMEIYVCPQADGQLEIVVNDEGGGIQPTLIDSDDEVQGVGLSLIQALTSGVELRGGAGDGTEVRMTFDVGRSVEFPPELDREGKDGIEIPPGETAVAVAAGPLAAPVLGRVVAMLAARADFSLERLSEAEIVTDAIAAHAPAVMLGRHVQVGFEVGERGLILNVGPLEDGGAVKMVGESSVGGMRPILETIPLAADPEPAAEGEILRLELGSN
jgi:serine/threonine-protein kinase RsbW